MKRIFLSMLAIAAMVSCSKTENLQPATDELVEVKFNSSVEAVAKAQQPFTAEYKGVIGVAATSGGAWIATPADYTKVGITIPSGGVITPASAIALPPASYDFCSVATDKAALPTRSGDNYPVAFGKVTGGEATTGGDMIYAKAAGAVIKKGASSVVLAYNHVYGKVQFAIQGHATDFTTAEIAGATIKVTGFIPTGTLDAKTGVVAPAATYTGAVDIRDTWYYAIPQTMSATNFLTVEVTIAGEKYNGTIKDVNGTIAADKMKTITITASRSGITFTSTLEEWTAETGAGTVN